MNTTSEVIVESTTPLSAELVDKSVQAAVAAIEVYNKPNFSYREEAFALLMSNAWEILLKAKWVFDHAEAIESLYELPVPMAPRFRRQIGVEIRFLIALLICLASFLKIKIQAWKRRAKTMCLRLLRYVTMQLTS
ncbi:hypothetical protein SAMN05216417_101322 [Nitrosospira multiformis]|uniref:DUF3644 domain-containing protein n=1 Tax=Nitrosospira multiformis TaxID=1231 RepID=A0A1I7FBB3_9PROT|nr:hypothetical protein SAMN05216417_101322 [Nitrosospira multiformis]